MAWIGKLYLNETGTVVVGCKEDATHVIIPNSVECIGERAFYDCSFLTSIVIPNSVTSIGDWAFSDCKMLTEFHLRNEHPENIKIGNNAFKGLENCTLIVPKGTGDAYRKDKRFKIFKEIIEV